AKTSDLPVFCTIRASRRRGSFYVRLVLLKEHAALDPGDKLPRPDRRGCRRASRPLHRALVLLESGTPAAPLYFRYLLDRARKSCAGTRRETLRPSRESSALRSSPSPLCRAGAIVL